MKNEENWLANYEVLKEHVLETGHFFNKHHKLRNWAKYQRKRIKAGTMQEEQKLMLEALEKMRSGEHTGGRRPKEALSVRPTSTSSAQRLKGGK